ncbi:MAG: methionine biosynthesis protein MetW [Piscirickettsiaceae bacterium]|jgi:methionine biosynthesis protein MetW|nr:methionine biosynthesis protein MetW [Piscirickettsiaceae bacterium]
MSLRPDLQIIVDWIPAGARVLDLGSGDGTLLTALQQHDVTGYGLEIDNSQIANCIKSGINIIQADLDQGLPQFADQSFDYVILSQTLQAVKRPNFLLDEIIRVGKQAIIGFPNFGHWQCRLQLAFRGQMPISKTLPNQWYDTTNIHLCTINDFEQICTDKNIQIKQRSIVDHAHQDSLGIKISPNLFGEIALYQIKKSH